MSVRTLVTAVAMMGLTAPAFAQGAGETMSLPQGSVPAQMAAVLPAAAAAVGIIAIVAVIASSDDSTSTTTTN